MVSRSRDSRRGKQPREGGEGRGGAGGNRAGEQTRQGGMDAEKERSLSAGPPAEHSSNAQLLHSKVAQVGHKDSELPAFNQGEGS